MAHVIKNLIIIIFQPYKTVICFCPWQQSLTFISETPLIPPYFLLANRSLQNRTVGHLVCGHHLLRALNNSRRKKKLDKHSSIHRDIVRKRYLSTAAFKKKSATSSTCSLRNLPIAGRRVSVTSVNIGKCSQLKWGIILFAKVILWRSWRREWSRRMF